MLRNAITANGKKNSLRSESENNKNVKNRNPRRQPPGARGTSNPPPRGRLLGPRTRPPGTSFYLSGRKLRKSRPPSDVTSSVGRRSAVARARKKLEKKTSAPRSNANVSTIAILLLRANCSRAKVRSFSFRAAEACYGRPFRVGVPVAYFNVVGSFAAVVRFLG